jgi:hypothetical protein
MSLKSAHLRDKPSLILIDRVCEAEGEPSATTILRRALRFYVKRVHSGMNLTSDSTQSKSGKR